MDLEVTKAFRTLERVGMSGPTPSMDLEEFKVHYGRLVYNWLKEHGFTIKVLRQKEISFKKARNVWQNESQQNETILAEATAKINQDAVTTVKMYNIGRFKNVSITRLHNASVNDEDQHIILSYLTECLVSDLVEPLDFLSDDSVPTVYKKNKKPALFIIEHAGGHPFKTQTHSNFSAQLFSYQPETSEEVAQRNQQNAAKLAKAEAQRIKRQEKAEANRVAKEQKELETLRKLTEKYGEILTERSSRVESEKRRES